MPIIVYFSIDIPWRKPIVKCISYAPNVVTYMYVYVKRLMRTKRKDKHCSVMPWKNLIVEIQSKSLIISNRKGIPNEFLTEWTNAIRKGSCRKSKSADRIGCRVNKDLMLKTHFFLLCWHTHVDAWLGFHTNYLVTIGWTATTIQLTNSSLD